MYCCWVFIVVHSRGCTCYSPQQASAYIGDSGDSRAVAAVEHPHRTHTMPGDLCARTSRTRARARPTTRRWMGHQSLPSLFRTWPTFYKLAKRGAISFSPLSACNDARRDLSGETRRPPRRCTFVLLDQSLDTLFILPANVCFDGRVNRLLRNNLLFLLNHFFFYIQNFNWIIFGDDDIVAFPRFHEVPYI